MSEFSRKRTLNKRQRLERAHKRVRSRVRGTAERPRLAVHKSRKYVYVQVIDDDRGHTVACASSLEPVVKKQLKGQTANKNAARLVGEVVAKRAGEKGVKTVVFDRGGYIYHGKIKELADGARHKGLKF
jgi:large subunit ribosomal protein L18